MKPNLITTPHRQPARVAAVGFYSFRQALWVVTGGLLLALMLALPALAQDKAKAKNKEKAQPQGRVEAEPPKTREGTDTLVVLRKNSNGTIDTVMFDYLDRPGRPGGKRIFRYRFGDGDKLHRMPFPPDAPGGIGIWGDTHDGEIFVFGDTAWAKDHRATADSFRKMHPDARIFGYRHDDRGDRYQNLRKRFRFYGYGPEFDFSFPDRGWEGQVLPRAPMPPRGSMLGFRDDREAFGEMKSSLNFEQFAFSPEGNSGYRLKLRTENLKDPIRIQIYNRNRESVFTDTGRNGIYDGKIDVSAFGPGTYLLEITQADKSFTRTVPIR